MESKRNIIEKLSKFVREIPGIEKEILTIFEIILHMKELRLFKDTNLKEILIELVNSYLIDSKFMFS